MAVWRRYGFEIDRRFIKLILLLDHGPQNEAGRFLEAGEQKRFDDLGELLDARRGINIALVLLGRPGCGKTTILCHLEHQLALRALPKSDADIPLVFSMPLNAYQEDNGTLPEPLDWLENAWKIRYPELGSLKALMKSRRVLLLLDALNEMPSRDAQEYSSRVARWRKALRTLRDNFGKTRVVFTCRSLDYSASLSDHQELPVPQVRFEDLDEDAIQAFLEARLPEHWEALWKQLDSPTRRELNKTPFYLDLEVKQFEARGRKLAKGQSELVSGLIWQTLKRETSKDNPGILANPTLIHKLDLQRLMDNRPWLDAPHLLPDDGALIPGLIRLAHAMQTQQGGGKQIRVSLTQADTAMESDHAEAIRSAGTQLDLPDIDLIVKQCAFSHQLLQEYIAGQHLAKSVDAAPLKKPWRAAEVQPPLDETIAGLGLAEPLPNLPASGWEETAPHAATISGDTEHFVRRVMEQDLALATRCALSPEVAVSEELADEIGRRLFERSRDPEADLRARIEAGLALGDLGDPRFTHGAGPDGHAYLLPPLVSIPGGAYLIGSPDNEGEDDEHPAHRVQVAKFQIGRFPVTNVEWRCFMDADGYQDPRW